MMNSCHFCGWYGDDLEDYSDVIWGASKPQAPVWLCNICSRLQGTDYPLRGWDIPNDYILKAIVALFRALELQPLDEQEGE